MNGVIAILSFLLMIMVLVFVPTLAAPFTDAYGSVTVFYCAKALGLCAFTAAIAGIAIRRNREHRSYLIKLFMFALLVRVLIGTAIFVFKGQDFFGGDAFTYDAFGNLQLLA